MNQKLLEFKEINLISKPVNEVLAFYNCFFCNKIVIDDVFCEMNKTLSGNNLYCNHCLRMGFNKKNSKNLIVSFKNIIAYYYYSFYISHGKKRTMWFSDIKNLINLHKKAGNRYPFMTYDEDTFLWFINFKKIGKNKKQIKLDNVKKALIDIAKCFEIEKHIHKFNFDKFIENIDEPIKNFYKSKCPARKVILFPILGNGELDRYVNLDNLNSFDSKILRQIT